MFIRSWENQEWFLFKCNHYLWFTWITTFQIIYLTFTKDECFCFECSLLKSDSFSHIFDILYNEINRYPIISEAWDDDISINYSRQDKIPKSIFNKFIILLEYTHNTSPSFSSISLQSSTKPNIILIIWLLPSQLIKILYVSRSLILLSWNAIRPSKNIILAGPM